MRLVQGCGKIFCSLGICKIIFKILPKGYNVSKHDPMQGLSKGVYGLSTGMYGLSTGVYGLLVSFIEKNL